MANRLSFDVEFTYTPGWRTNEHDEPETMEIESVHYYGDMIELFDYYQSFEQIMDEIKQRIRDTH